MEIKQEKIDLIPLRKYLEDRDFQLSPVGNRMYEAKLHLGTKGSYIAQHLYIEQLKDVKFGVESVFEKIIAPYFYSKFKEFLCLQKNI